MFFPDMVEIVLSNLSDTDTNCFLQINKEIYVIFNKRFRQISLSQENSFRYLSDMSYRNYIDSCLTDNKKQLTLNLKHSNCSNYMCNLYDEVQSLSLTKVYMNGCNYYGYMLMEEAFYDTEEPNILCVDHPSQRNIMRQLKYFCDIDCDYDIDYIKKENNSSFVTLTSPLKFKIIGEIVEIYLDELTKSSIIDMKIAFNKCLKRPFPIENDDKIYAELTSIPEHILMLLNDIKPIGMIEYYKKDGNIYEHEVKLSDEGEAIFGITIYVPYNENKYKVSISSVYSDDVVNL